MRPPLRWFGSKTRIAPRLVAMLPEHDHYVEPFAGSAAVLFAKPRSPLETLNDIDGEVINLFRVLRDPASAEVLAEQVALTPYARDEFGAAKEPVDAPIERARRFLVLAHQAVGNAGQGWAYVARASAVSAARSHRWANLPNRLQACAERLCGVQIDSVDWRVCLERYDRPGVVMLIDPPYHHETRPNTVGDYRHEMAGHDDHQDLVTALLELEHAAAVVTHYPHPLYDRLTAAGWDTTDLTSHADNPTARRQESRVERVWCSRPVEARLFGEAT